MVICAGTWAAPDMGLRKLSWFLLLLAACSLVPTVSTLQCWSCSSDTDPDCADPFDSAQKATCECDEGQKGEKPVCATVVLQVNSLEKITTRGCDWAPIHGPENATCHMKLPAHSSIELCHICREDGCNSVEMQQPTHLVYVIPFLILFLLGPLQYHL